ncbi:Centromere/kinetochore Zw10-domain-containing protein [Mucidula mucida]|nr:Centromere/kinetochore Zw10-domain-containing protein [Mucidula mucida]
MAFPIPAHLPRRGAPPQDVSSAILAKIDAATSKTLTPSLAASWLRELDQNILDTKKRIHDRLHGDLPLFEQQEASAKSVQTRLHALTTEIEDLTHKLSAPESGLVPTLISTLTKHAALQQETAEANVLYDCLDHLSRFKAELTSLDGLIRDGQLPQAVQAYRNMDKLSEEHPRPLAHSEILIDLKSKFRATRARAEDQLSDAYNRSIVVSPDTLIILPTIKVRQSATSISLSEILASLTSSALLNHLNLLRRDLMALYVIRILEQSSPISLTLTDEHTLSCSPVPPNGDALDNVSTVLNFVSTYLLAALPSPQDVQFAHSLHKPITQSVLDNLLIPSLPPSFEPLASYLELLKKSVKFEEEIVDGVLGREHRECLIANWANGIDGHYERQRRLLILDAARDLIVSSSAKFDTFTVQVEQQPEPSVPTVVPVQDDVSENDAWGLDESPAETLIKAGESKDTAADSWGFDDDGMDVDPSPHQNGNGNGKMDTDPSDAWGWNDDEASPSQDEVPWDDDPWGDPPVEDEKPPVITSPPKIANGLFKKDKKHLNGHSPSTSSPIIPSPSISSPSVPQKPPEKQDKRPPNLAPPKESYLVSSQMQEILGMIENVLNEGTHLAESRIFSTSVSPGTLILLTAPSILDLYRAMTPAVFGKELQTSLNAPMMFSNNCLYLSSALDKIEPGAAKERLRDAQRRLKVLGDSWYSDTVVSFKPSARHVYLAFNVQYRQRESLDKIIVDGAAGFTFTGDQDRYDECEAALSRALQDIRQAAAQWRGVLTKSKYYAAIGAITEAVLSRVLDDITALPDIPEVESRRLSELCRILHALEGLFVEDPEKPSFVVAYVPSWLKFSYLSELLEASMADFRYLFEEGALVDFEIDELVRLVRALFADTSLRTETINKLSGGHPFQSPSL